MAEIAKYGDAVNYRLTYHKPEWPQSLATSSRLAVKQSLWRIILLEGMIIRNALSGENRPEMLSRYCVTCCALALENNAAL